MKRFAIAALLALFALIANEPARAQKISTLQAATTPLSGSEVLVCNQGGVTSQCPVNAVGATMPNGTVTLGQNATLPANTIVGNNTGSMGTQLALTPVQTSLMHALGWVVQTVAITNITLSGLQAIDGNGTGTIGEVVLVNGQTSASQNGIYLMQTGAWTRVPYFPSGFVLPAQCNLMVTVELGSVYAGSTWRFNPTVTSTIGTTAINFVQFTPQTATAATAGVVQVTEIADGVKVPTFVGTVSSAYSCVSFYDSNVGTSGSIGDIGNTAGDVGFCVVSDPNGHPYVDVSGTAPGITGTGCSFAVTSTDNHGAITATGVDTCTVTFSNVAGSAHSFAKVPFCTVAGESATVLPYIGTRPTVDAVIFKTAAAGTFEYNCL